MKKEPITRVYILGKTDDGIICKYEHFDNLIIITPDNLERQLKFTGVIKIDLTPNIDKLIKGTRKI